MLLAANCLLFLAVIGMQTIIEKKQSGFEMDVCMCTYSEAREPEYSYFLIYVS